MTAARARADEIDRAADRHYRTVARLSQLNRRWTPFRRRRPPRREERR